MRVLIVLVVLCLVMAVSVQAAPSYLGPTGNILTPDTLTAPAKGFDIGYHFLSDTFGSDVDRSIVHGNIGLTPAIEVGLSWVDDNHGGSGDSDLSVNGKWRFLEETATGPALAVGVLDLTSDAFDNNDPSFYFVVSKNLTAVAEDVANGQSKPLRGTLGIGGGFYDGIFAALDWTLAPQLSVMAEYTQAGDNLFSGGVRWAATPEIRLDAALIDFTDFGAGISYTKGF